MHIELTDQQKKQQLAFKAFVEQAIAPHANRYDQEEHIPLELIKQVAQQGFLGALLPQEYGGAAMDMLTFGLLNEELARGCSSVRSLLTVHTMVALSILKWGSRQQKEQWLPKLALGETIAAFALSEPDVGCDASNVQTSATLAGNTYILHGHKKWITFGQVANVFLVFTHCEGKPTAFLVERDSPGLAVTPLSGMLGTRASGLAELQLEGCRVPKEHLVGKVGAGFAFVASSALHYGRYSVAWGCVGLAQACLDATLAYTSQRKQFGAYLKEHQLIRQMVTDMVTNIHAARLLCLHASRLIESGAAKAVAETSLAKYFASTMALKVASDAVQVHGANGCSSDYAVQRYFRDAKIMEIIEGSTQMQQITIAQYAYQEYLPLV